MGTDIFLKWDGMNEDEEAMQLSASSAFRLDAGCVGYLRAAIGMKRENALLRFVFPERYWYNASHRPMQFDFRGGLSTLNCGVKIYLRSIREGVEPAFRSYDLVASMDRATKELVRRSGLEQVTSTEDLDVDEAARWLLGVAEFFSLGVKKMDEGKNPRILISW